MKYLLSIYTNPANWEALSPSERDTMMSEYFAFTQEITESGEFLDGDQLADHNTAQTVRVRAGGTQVVDGPFAESKEHLAGFYLVECDSPKRAAELAAKIPDARYNAIEVRALLDNGGQEM
jgi:hypothetical protein